MGREKMKFVYIDRVNQFYTFNDILINIAQWIHSDSAMYKNDAIRKRKLGRHSLTVL